MARRVYNEADLFVKAFVQKMTRFEIIVFVAALMFLDMGLYDFLAFVSLLAFIAIFRLRH